MARPCGANSNCPNAVNATTSTWGQLVARWKNLLRILYPTRHAACIPSASNEKENHTMRQVVIALMSVTLALGMASCKEADKVENKITCSDVCKRYRDCFDANYDT